MIASLPNQPDWFVVSAELAAIAGVSPGVKFKKSRFEVHRSMLPLMKEDLEVSRLLDRFVDIEGRAQRDKLTEPLGFTLRPHQHAGVEFVEGRRGSLIADQMRVGKAQPLTAKILTPDGWTTMGKLKVGDAVVDPITGGATKVVGVYPQGTRRIYKVTASDGSYTECDEEHLWQVTTSEAECRGGIPRVLTTRKIKEKLEIVLGGKPCFKWILPLTAPVKFKEKILPLDPYVMGLLLGNGSFRTSVTLSTSDAELLAAFKKEAKKFGLLIRTDGHDHFAHGDGHYALNPIKEVLEGLGLWGHLAQTKFIPPEYLLGSIKQRWAVLRGLMDTDGCPDSSTEFYSTSFELANGVIDLVRSLGGVAWIGTEKLEPKYSYKGEIRIGDPCWVVRINLTKNPFKLKRKAKLWKGGGQRRKKIATIEFIREDEAQCIQVASKDALYITDGHIVTHNTVIPVMAHKEAQGNFIVFCPKMVREVWLGWIQRRWPGAEVGKDIAILAGQTFDKSVANKPFIICHYDIMKHWQSVASKEIGTLVFDEAHVLSKLNQRTIAASFIASRAKNIIGLTGTPLWNKPNGLWMLLNMLGQEGWGSQFDFGMRFCGPEPTAYGTKFNGASNTTELMARLSEVMICRTLKETMANMPEITRDVLIADITPEERLQIDVAAEDLKQADSKYTAIGALARYRQILGKFKVAVTVDAVVNVLERNEPAVVWIWHKDVAKDIQAGIRKKGYKAFIIDGDVSDKKREKILAEWRAHPNALLIMAILVGQAGIDLSHARIAFFAEIDFTPAVVAQAGMRIFSSLRPMHVSYVVVDHAVDRQIIGALQTKLDASDAMNVPAAESAVEVLLQAFSGSKLGEGDLNRLMLSMLDSGLS